jgi:Transposase IS66 family
MVLAWPMQDVIRSRFKWVASHYRRKFMDAKKARGKNCKKTGGADAGMKFIKDLYRVENKIAALSSQERIEIRNLEAKPILDKMHHWLIQKSNQVTPGSLLVMQVNITCTIEISQDTIEALFYNSIHHENHLDQYSMIPSHHH